MPPIHEHNNVAINMFDNVNPDEAWQPFEPEKDKPWDLRLASHLYRRAWFGGNPTQIQAAVKLGFAESVASILKPRRNENFEAEMNTAARMVTGGSDSRQLAAWWILRMLKTSNPLVEKMTFFWHGHFATGAEKVLNSRAMLRQNQLLRKHALGEYPPLVQSISQDVAMLVYLDSEENRKTRPNENYARELMELFCLGVGNYSEQDIKEVAKCFTGCEVKKGKYQFNEYQHDHGVKSFLNRSGKFRGDDAINIIMEQPAAGRFLAKKLIRFFVFDDLAISDRLAEPLAEHLRATDFNITKALNLIFSSKLFYSDAAIGKKIKSPLELSVGFLHFLGATTNITEVSRKLAAIGQLPLFPPNVKGWEGGKNWINASTILARANLTSGILANEKTKYDQGELSELFGIDSPLGAIDSAPWVNDYFFASPLTRESETQYLNWIKRTNAQPKEILAYLTALPEFQLN